MVKSVSPDLAAHLDGEVTTLATLWRVTRTDGLVVGFTDADLDLTVDVDGGADPIAYAAASGYTRTAIQSTASLSVDNVDIESHLDPAFSQITEADIRAGKWDFAEVEMFLVNYRDLTQGVVRLRRGYLGEVSLRDRIYFAELRGLVQLLSQQIGEVYSAACRADLGDGRCKVPLFPAEVERSTAYAAGAYVRVRTAGGGEPVTWFDYEDRVYRCVAAGITAAAQPAYDTTVGAQTTDGTAVFEAEESWTRAIAVSEVIDARRFKVTQLTPNAGGPRGGFPDDWFRGGLVRFETGANAGLSQEVDRFVADDGVAIVQTIDLFLPLPFPLAAGDQGLIAPGCRKDVADCRDRFGNVLNYRGEPYIPGNDQMLRAPDAPGGG